LVDDSRARKILLSTIMLQCPESMRRIIFPSGLRNHEPHEKQYLAPVLIDPEVGKAADPGAADF
jgi:hypothetical protein